MPIPTRVLSFESWKEDAIDAIVGAAEQLYSNNPIEFTHENPKVDYQLGIMVRATYEQEPQGDETRGKGLDGRLHLEGTLPMPTPLYPI